MLAKAAKDYLDGLKLQNDKAVQYSRNCEGVLYSLKIMDNLDGVTIQGRVQTLDELEYMVGRLAAELKGGTNGKDESGQAGHEPAEAVASTSELVTA